MKQMQVEGVVIEEYSDRSRDIQRLLEEMLEIISILYHFTWTAPTHDIVRRLMNEVQEFKPLEEEQP